MIFPGGVSSHVKQHVSHRKDVIHYEKYLMRASSCDATLWFETTLFHL